MSDTVKVHMTDEPPHQPKDGYHWIQATNLEGDTGWVEVHEQTIKTTLAMRQKDSYWIADQLKKEE